MRDTDQQQDSGHHSASSGELEAIFWNAHDSKMGAGIIATANPKNRAAVLFSAQLNLLLDLTSSYLFRVLDSARDELVEMTQPQVNGLDQRSACV